MSNLRKKFKDKSPEEIKKIFDDAWLNIVVDEDTLFNPLLEIPEEYKENPNEYILWLMTRPEYFSFICSEILNIDLLPFQALLLQELWNRKFPMLLASRGLGKSYLLAVYGVLRALLLPKRKVVICGASFRQSKVIYEYMCNIWNNSPLLRDMVGSSSSGPKSQPDMCRLVMRDSMITALPIGNGDKIRGQRANDIFIDEFASLNVEIFENVIAGFAAVTANPVENVKKQAAKLLRNSLGFHDTMLEHGSASEDNQIIITGTAYYKFNHFYQYFSKWHNIINSRGDEKILKEMFPDKKVPKNFDWKNYSIIRIPYDVAPAGFMDDDQITRSKATINNGIFQMEFGACGVFETPIVTKNGIKQLGLIEIGDYVLTHKGRFRKVIKKTYKPYNGKICNIDTYGYYKTLTFTPTHPFYDGKDFIDAKDIEKTVFCNIKELSELKTIKIKDISKNIVTRKGYCYPYSSKRKYDIEKENRVLELDHFGYSVSEIKEKTGIKVSSIYRILNDNTKPKNSIIEEIKLDYFFGLVIGYYASEGSINKRGTSVEFALDGHIDKKLEYFIKELVNAIEKSLDNTNIKQYNSKENNTKRICFNSRVFSDLIKHICPGNCYTKKINHEILFSNKEFLTGFIVGMWNGDGHIRNDSASITLTNKDMIMQIKLALSYFNINASFLKPKNNGITFIKGKESKKQQAYKLLITGSEFRKFKNIFYGENNNTDNKKDLVFSEDNSINYVKDIFYTDYDGLVYNLEVEEDNTYSTPNATVHNCFSSDSSGFFKRSLIESCTPSPKHEIELPSGNVMFHAVTTGSNDRKYIFGIDPASEVDNFSITVLEIHNDHRRVVYCWTTNREKQKEAVKAKLTNETDYYAFCARKIRDLMKVFPCDGIAIDSQGGGIAVIEALHDKDKMQEGESQIWEVIDYEKPKDTDNCPGLHLIYKINFSSADFTSSANHGMKKDLEDKILLFPYFDAMQMAIESTEENLQNRIYDTYEDCVFEIESLKDELCLITITQTLSGRDHWDTPEIKLPGNKKGRMRKDRYSSLLMANFVARDKFRVIPKNEIIFYGGGFASKGGEKTESSGQDYMGPAWFVNKMNGVYK